MGRVGQLNSDPEIEVKVVIEDGVSKLKTCGESHGHLKMLTMIEAQNPFSVTTKPYNTPQHTTTGVYIHAYLHFSIDSQEEIKRRTTESASNLRRWVLSLKQGDSQQLPSQKIQRWPKLISYRRISTGLKQHRKC